MAGSGLNPFFNASRQGLNDFEVLDRLANNDSRSQRTTNHLYALINARNAGKQLTLQAQAVMFDVERAPGAIPPPSQGVQAWQELNETNNAIKGVDNQPAKLDYQGWHQAIGLPSAADQLFIDNVRIKDKEARIEDLRSIQIPGNILRSGVSQTAQNLTGPILNTLRTIYQILTTPGSLPPKETPNQGSVFQNHQVMAIERMSAAAYASLMAYGHLLTAADMDVIASEAHKISNPTNLLVPGWYQMPGNSQYGPDLTRMRQLIQVIDGLLGAAKNRVGSVYEQRAPTQNPGAGGFFMDRIDPIVGPLAPMLINLGAQIDRIQSGTANTADYARVASAAAAAGAAGLATSLFPMQALGAAAGGLGAFLLARQGQGKRGGAAEEDDEIPSSMAPVPSLFEGDRPSGPFQPQAPSGMSMQDPRLTLASTGSQQAVNSLPAPSSSAAGENTGLTILEPSGPTLMRTVARPSFSFPSTLQITPTLLTGAYRTLADGTFAEVPQQNKPPVTLSTNLPQISETVQTGTPPDIGPDTAPEGLEAYKTAADMTSLACASLLSHPGYSPKQKVAHVYLMNHMIASEAMPDQEEEVVDESARGGAKSNFAQLIPGAADADSKRDNKAFMAKALKMLAAATAGAVATPAAMRYLFRYGPTDANKVAHQPTAGVDPWAQLNNKQTTENFGHMSYAVADNLMSKAHNEASERAKFTAKSFNDAIKDFAEAPYSSVAKAVAQEAYAWATKYHPETMVGILKEYQPVLEEKMKLQAKNTELSQKNALEEMKGRLKTDVDMTNAAASAATSKAQAEWSKFYNGLYGHLSGIMSPMTPIANGAYTLATDTVPNAVSNYLEAGKDAWENAKKAFADYAALENKAYEFDPATIALIEGFTKQPLEGTTDSFFPDYLAGDPTQMREYYKNYWTYADRETHKRQEYLMNRTRINDMLAQSRAFFAEHPEQAEGRDISAAVGWGKPKTVRKAQKIIGGDKQVAAEAMAEAQDDQQHNEEGVQENTTDILASMTGSHRVPTGGDGSNFAETIAANARVFNFTPALNEFMDEVKQEYEKIVSNKESSPGGIPADSDSYYMSAIQKACMRVAVSALNSGTHLVSHIPSIPPPMRLEPNPLVPVSGTPGMAGPSDGVPLPNAAYEEVAKAENGQFTSTQAPGAPQGQKALLEAVQALNLQPGGHIMQGIPSRVSNGITSDIDMAAQAREQAALAEFQKRKNEQTAAAATQALQTDKVALDALTNQPPPPPPPPEENAEDDEEEKMVSPKEEAPPNAVEAFKPPKPKYQEIIGLKEIIDAIRGVGREFNDEDKKGNGRGTKRAPSAWSTLVKETYHELKKENPSITLAQAAQVASKRRKTGEGAKKNDAEGVKHGGNIVTDLWNKATNELTNKDSILNKATGNVAGKVSNELYNTESDLNKATWNAGKNLTTNLLDPINTTVRDVVAAPVDIAEHAYQKGKELTTDYMAEGVGSDVLDPLTMVQICEAAYMTSNGKEPPKQIGACMFVTATPYDVLYRLPSGNHVVGVRGTVLTDPGDLEADLRRIVPSNLVHSARYAKDRDTVIAWKQTHPSAFYYATGHSLGGAICDELIKAKLVSKAYTFNPAVQTTDFLTNLPNTRLYSDKDPLYILMGQYARGSHVRKTKDNVTGLMKIMDNYTQKSVDTFLRKHTSGLFGNPFPAGVLETAMSHQLHNFKDLEGLPVGYGKKGGALFDDIKNLAGKVTNEFTNPDSLLRQTPGKVTNEFVNPESVLNKAVESTITGALDSLSNTLDYWTARQYKPSTAAFMAKHGGEQLANLKIRRYPVPGYIDQAFNMVSAGKWGEAKKSASYDDFFHLGIIMDNKYVFEKNASLNFFEGVDHFPGEMFMDVTKKIAKGLTIGIAMEKTRAVIGNEAFFRYDPFNNNCQNFVSAFLGVNNLITPDLDAYISQPVDEVLKNVPSYVPAFGRTLTNLGAFFGMGKKKKSKRRV